MRPGAREERRGRSGPGHPRWLPLCLLAGCLFVASPAHANMYVPSLVEFLAAPLLWSVFGVTLLISVPLLLFIALLEALVLRRYTVERPFRKLLVYLAVVNAITSVLGTVLSLKGFALWPHLGLAFVATVLVEAILLRLRSPGLPEPVRLHTALKVSFWMNAASYTAIAVTLAVLVYLPGARDEDPSVAASARGVIVAIIPWSDGASRYQAALPAVTSRASGYPLSGLGLDYEWPGMPSSDASELAYRPSGDGGLYEIADGKLARRLSYARGKWSATPLPRALAAPPDDKPAGLGADAANARLNPGATLAAWQEGQTLHVQDVRTRRQRVFRLPGRTWWIDGPVAWSPDGQLIAYLGGLNRFTYRRFVPDVCAVRVIDGATATIHRGLRMGAVPEHEVELFWLR